MSAFQSIEWLALGYLLNSLWQVPLIFASAWAAARMARRAGSRMEHKVWVGALMLEAVLPVCHFQPGSLWRGAGSVVAWFSGAGAGGETRVLIGPGAVAGNAMLRLPEELLAAIVLAYGFGLLYLAGRLGWGLWKTHGLLREAKPLAGRQTALERSGALWGSGEMRIAVSPTISGPVTVGVMQRVLLLPAGFIDSVGERDLEAAVAHEFAHMRRRDFAKNLFYEVLSLPVAYHPAVWLTRARLAETREMICDGMAAEAVGGPESGPESYVRSLLRLASMLSDQMPARTLHAIGIFDANILERRVMKLTERRVEVRGARRLGIAAACGVVAVTTCLSALALRVNVDAPAKSATAPARLTVKAGDLVTTYKKQPVYPVEAKASKDIVNGAVVLAVTIGKDGAAEHVAVQKSLRDDYDRSALDAVREWHWRPYLLNGEPVEVDSTVTVVYSVAE